VSLRNNNNIKNGSAAIITTKKLWHRLK